MTLVQAGCLPSDQNDLLTFCGVAEYDHFVQLDVCGRSQDISLFWRHTSKLTHPPQEELQHRPKISTLLSSLVQYDPIQPNPSTVKGKGSRKKKVGVADVVT